MDMEKRTQELRDRLKYIQDIFAPDENSNVSMLETRFGEFVSRVPELNKQEAVRQLETLEELFRFLEKKLERDLTPMNKVHGYTYLHRKPFSDILVLL